jgi:hypothetical protein
VPDFGYRAIQGFSLIVPKAVPWMPSKKAAEKDRAASAWEAAALLLNR